MAKSKKKQSPHEANKLAAAQHKNEFFRNVTRFAKHCGNEKILSMIPEKEKDLLYKLHCHKIKIKFEDESKNNDKKYQEMIKGLKEILNTIKVPITDNGFEVSLADYYSYPMTINLYIFKLEDDRYPAAKEFKKTFLPFTDFPQGFAFVNDTIDGILNTFGIIFNNFNKEIYSCKFDTFNYLKNRASPAGCVFIKVLTPKRINVTINNISRPAIQLIWAFTGADVNKLTIKGADFGIKTAFSELKLDVYIQQHALIRLEERLDNIPAGMSHFGIFESLLIPKIIKDKHGNFLIEYKMLNHKLGYLRVDLLDGIVVIRTFLFITNNDTPEGEILNSMIGVEKLDKEYLLIDKLSTFSSEKIRNNEKIKEIFTKSGCTGIFKCSEQLKGLVFSKDISSEMMIKYLGIIQPPVVSDEIEINNSDNNNEETS